MANGHERNLFANKLLVEVYHNPNIYIFTEQKKQGGFIELKLEKQHEN